VLNIKDYTTKLSSPVVRLSERISETLQNNKAKAIYSIHDIVIYILDIYIINI
jgi:hypothetical protein